MEKKAHLHQFAAIEGNLSTSKQFVQEPAALERAYPYHVPLEPAATRVIGVSKATRSKALVECILDARVQ